MYDDTPCRLLIVKIPPNHVRTGGFFMPAYLVNIPQLVKEYGEIADFT